MSGSLSANGDQRPPRCVLVTGAAGYVGGLLIEALARQTQIDRIVGLDMKPRPEALDGIDGLTWIQADLSEPGWEDEARACGVEAVIHLAFQIRQLYGSRRAQMERWNLGGAKRLFDFVFGESGARRLIHFSTVSAYGAYADNSADERLTESEPLREDGYLYGVHKRQIEAILEDCYARSDRSTEVMVVRPASITGPRGRGGYSRFGLVSTLAGMLPLIPVGRLDWCRQYLHEDEAADIVTRMLVGPRLGDYEVFNLSPYDYVSAQDFAELFGEGAPVRKRVVRVPPFLIRMAFALLWHGTRGRIGTPPGGWRFLTYPIAVDGSKLTRFIGYRYHFSSREALTGKAGRNGVPTTQPAVAS